MIISKLTTSKFLVNSMAGKLSLYSNIANNCAYCNRKLKKANPDGTGQLLKQGGIHQQPREIIRANSNQGFKMLRSLTNKFSLEAPEPQITGKPTANISTKMLRSSYQLDFNHRSTSECATAYKEKESDTGTGQRESYEADEKIVKNKIHRDQMLAG